MPKQRSHHSSPAHAIVGTCVAAVLLFGWAHRGQADPKQAEAIQDREANAPRADPAMAGSTLSGLRTWTDATGRFKIDAEFVEITEGKVRLRKATGATVAVPLDKLCDADRAFVQGVSSGASKPSPTPLIDAAPKPPLPGKTSLIDTTPKPEPVSKGPSASATPAPRLPLERPGTTSAAAPQSEPSQPLSANAGTPTPKTIATTPTSANIAAPPKSSASRTGILGMPGWAWGSFFVIALAGGLYVATVVRKKSRLATRPSQPAGERPKAAGAGFAMVDAASGTGKLIDHIKRAVAEAKRQGLQPFAYFYADWCPPCKALRASMTDRRMIDAFQGTYVVKLCADQWKDEAARTGFRFQAVPVFFRLDDQGRPGDHIDGGAWGANTPENMAGPLKRFFHVQSTPHAPAATVSASSTGSTDGESLYRQAVTLFGQNKFSDALRLLEQAAVKLPNSPAVFFTLGITYIKTAPDGNEEMGASPWVEKGINALKKAIALNNQFGGLNENQLATARDAVAMQSSDSVKHTANSVLHLIDRHGLTDPEALLREVRKLGSRDEICAALALIERGLESGELGRSRIMTGAIVQTVRQML